MAAARVRNFGILLDSHANYAKTALHYKAVCVVKIRVVPSDGQLTNIFQLEKVV